MCGQGTKRKILYMVKNEAPVFSDSYKNQSIPIALLTIYRVISSNTSSLSTATVEKEHPQVTMTSLQLAYWTHFVV